MSDDAYTKNVGFTGAVSVLMCSITGPAIISIPYVFQTAGWFITVLLFGLMSVLATIGSLLLTEALTKFPGNENFERNVEFTVLIHQFYGRTVYYLMHIILYGSVQSFNIASLIAAVAQMDSAFVNLFGATCGYGISPVDGIYCVTQEANTNSPFGENYMLFSLGYLIVLLVMIPMLSVDLNDNMIVQFASLLFLFLVLLTWGIQAIQNGFDMSLIPAFGSNMAVSIPNILFNYTLANTIPSVVNVMHKSVSVQKTLWLSTGVSTLMYIFVGLMPGFSFNVPIGTNVIQAIATSDIPASSKSWNAIVNVLFSFLVYLTSIPVAMIIVRLNLVSSRICSKGTANILAIFVPIIVTIPMMTGTWNDRFQTWTSLFFQAPCNFFAPFMVYLFLSRRNMVMQQSVIDELEFLDIEAGVKKRTTDDDDDDFDYVYHLPHADLSRLGARRNPFATEEEKRNGGSQASRMDARYVSTSGLSVTSRMSGRSISKKKVRAMLGAAPENQGFNSLVASKINASRLSLAASVHEGGFHGSSRRGSIASMMGGPLQPVIPMRTGRRGSTLAGMGDAPHAGPPVPQFDGNRRASMLGAGALHLDSHRRTSTFGPGLGLGNGRVMPMSEPEQQNVSVNLLVSDETESVDETSWRALPKWWTDIIPNRVTASVSLVIVSGLTGYVLVYDIMYPPT